MSDPTVSVIIPAYRSSATIARALDSVFAQTVLPDEIIVVDDGSPDELMAALLPYRGRITLMRKPNGGAASARNLGIDHSSGDLIAFLDADDYWEPNKLERQIQVFRRHPEIGLTSCRFYFQEPGAPRTEPFGVVEVPDLRHFGVARFDQVVSPIGPEILTVVTRILTSAVMVRRKALGDLRFTRGLEPAEDRDLWIYLVSSTPVYLDSAPMTTQVSEPGSLSRSNVDVDFGNMVRVIHRHAHLIGCRGTRRWEAVFFRLWAACLLGEGDPAAALRPAWNRFLRQPYSPEGWWVLLKSAAGTMAVPRWYGRARSDGEAAAPRKVFGP